MKKMRTRMFSMLLVCAMLLTLLPVTAFAAGEGTAGNPFTTVNAYNAAVRTGDWDGKDIYLTIQGTEDSPKAIGAGEFGLVNVQKKYDPPKLHLTINYCDFTGNTSGDQSNPSFMYLSNCQELNISDCTFDADSGLTYGINWNLIQIKDAAVSITGCTFEGEYEENAIKLNQRNGDDDVYKTDILPTEGEGTKFAATIESAEISNCVFSGATGSNIILLGSAGKGEGGAAAPSTGAFPVTIKAADNSGVGVFLAYLATESQALAAMQEPAQAVADGLAVQISGGETAVKAAKGDPVIAGKSDPVAQIGTNQFLSLSAALQAAEAGDTVELLKDATLSKPVGEGVTLSVSKDAALTVQADGLTNLAAGTLEVKAGGELVLGSGVLVGGSGNSLNLTEGSVTMKGTTVTLTQDSKAEIPAGKTFYLMLGSGGPALDAVIAEGAELTVKGTLKAVSGSDSAGSDVTVKGTLDVTGALTIAQKATVTVEDGGTMKLPVMTKEAMGSDTAGAGMNGDITVQAGAHLTYASADVLGGNSPLLNLASGSATLNLGGANDSTAPAVSLRLEGKASVASDLKALWVTSDGVNTFVPMAITLAAGSEATVPAGTVLNLVNNSSLKVDEAASFAVAEGGILEVHSSASFDGKAAVSGKVYVFEASGGTNPAANAVIALGAGGAVYAEKTELEGTSITPALKAASTESYISTSSSTPTTFTTQWTFCCKITLDANGGTLANGITEFQTGADGKLTAMPANPSYSGYQFKGWYDAAVGGSKVDTTTVFSQDDTIYAQWIKEAPSTDTDSGSATGDYLVNVDRTTGGKVTVTPGRADKGDTVTITVKPDDGYVLDELTVTAREGGAVKLTFQGGNKYTFKMPGSAVTVTAAFVKEGSGQPAAGLPFTDVAKSAWYYDAVAYAYENELFNGTSATTFSPLMDMSRAMIWTVLARMEGVNTSGGSVWYEAGMTWAMAEGISDGTNPDSSVTREQLVTMLWRYAGSPAAAGSLSGYPDSASVSDWAVDAMVWAVKNGIITGDGAGALNPQGTATRAEVATILMRYLEKGI